MIAFAPSAVAFAINSFIASFFHAINAFSYAHDLPPKKSENAAKISLNTFAQTITSEDINHLYSDIWFHSIV